MKKYENFKSVKDLSTRQLKELFTNSGLMLIMQYGSEVINTDTDNESEEFDTKNNILTNIIARDVMEKELITREDTDSDSDDSIEELIEDMSNKTIIYEIDDTPKDMLKSNIEKMILNFNKSNIKDSLMKKAESNIDKIIDDKMLEEDEQDFLKKLIKSFKNIK